MKDLSATPELLMDAADGEHVLVDGRTFRVSLRTWPSPDSVFLTDVDNKLPRLRSDDYRDIHVRALGATPLARGAAVVERLEMVRMIGLRKYVIG